MIQVFGAGVYLHVGDRRLAFGFAVAGLVGGLGWRGWLAAPRGHLPATASPRGLRVPNGSEPALLRLSAREHGATGA